MNVEVDGAPLESLVHLGAPQRNQDVHGVQNIEPLADKLCCAGAVADFGGGQPHLTFEAPGQIFDGRVLDDHKVAFPHSAWLLGAEDIMPISAEDCVMPHGGESLTTVFHFCQHVFELHFVFLVV
jgi:hypothetical protein